MYTRIQFGKELKNKVLTKESTAEIGSWAFSVYFGRMEEMDDPNFDHVLLTLNKMELGPEFALSYERLDEIANDLISGDEVNLDY